MESFVTGVNPSELQLMREHATTFLELTFKSTGGDCFSALFCSNVPSLCLFPNRRTNTITAYLTFPRIFHRSTYLSGGIFCQTTQMNPLHLCMLCFDMTATPSCYCHESTWQVSSDVETSAMQLFLQPHQLFLISKLSIFLFEPLLPFSPAPTSASHSSQ